MFKILHAATEPLHPCGWSGNIKRDTHPGFLGAKVLNTEQEELKTQLARNTVQIMKPHLHLHWLLAVVISKSSLTEWKEKWGEFKWTLCFEIVSSVQEWRCGHLNKTGKKNKWRSTYFHLEEKQETLNTECQQFKELQWRCRHTYAHTHTCIRKHTICHSIWTNMRPHRPLQGHARGYWGYQLPCTHTYMFKHPLQSLDGTSHCFVTFAHTHKHTHTLSQTHTRPLVASTVSAACNQ